MEGVLIFGLVNSINLALITVGFSLVVGISGIPNFAHGAFYILGGCLAWLMMHYLGLPYLLSIGLTIIATCVLSAVMYWVVLLRVRGLVLAEVVATFGVGIAILEFLRWTDFVGFHYRLPIFLRGSLEIGGVFLDYQRLFIVLVGLALVLFLWVFTRHTKVGLSFRAIAQNESTALSLGIRSDWVATLSLVLGSVLAVMAAVVILPLGIITIDTGYHVLTLALAVAVVGGMESTKGIITASFILGYSQTIAASALGPMWMLAVFPMALVVALAIKPSGIFGKFKELEERV
jgi:branched-chain amino acid transport system permease protein